MRPGWACSCVDRQCYVVVVVVNSAAVIDTDSCFSSLCDGTGHAGRLQRDNLRGLQNKTKRFFHMKYPEMPKGGEKSTLDHSVPTLFHEKICSKNGFWKTGAAMLFFVKKWRFGCHALDDMFKLILKSVN